MLHAFIIHFHMEVFGSYRPISLDTMFILSFTSQTDQIMSTTKIPEAPRDLGCSESAEQNKTDLQQTWWKTWRSCPEWV